MNPASDGARKHVRAFLAVGGEQRHARSLGEREEGWYKFQRGLALQIDSSTGLVSRQLHYVSPPDACAPDEPAILFKSSTLVGDTLYACTQTEVLIYALPEYRLTSYLTLPFFNDVHHVRPTPRNTLLVAISGLDAVVEVSLAGELLQEWSTLGGSMWERFSPAIDYRRVPSTKPHRSHPNQVFFIGDEPWVTRFEQRDAISLLDSQRRISVAIERVHDGVAVAERIYFTTVNGHVVIARADTLGVEEVIDLNALYPNDDLLGWCRGICVVGEQAWVGFSRLRLTALRENLSWVRNRFRRHLPTRMVCIDLQRRVLLREIDLQAHGMDAVFSIHALCDRA